MFKVKLLKYDKKNMTKELVGIMNIDDAEKIIEENQENLVIYQIIRLSALQNRRLNKIGKEKFEQMIRDQMIDYIYTPAQ